jgi:hypothetical protein
MEKTLKVLLELALHFIDDAFNYGFRDAPASYCVAW